MPSPERASSEASDEDLVGREHHTLTPRTPLLGALTPGVAAALLLPLSTHPLSGSPQGAGPSQGWPEAFSGAHQPIPGSNGYMHTCSGGPHHDGPRSLPNSCMQYQHQQQHQLSLGQALLPQNSGSSELMRRLQQAPMLAEGSEREMSVDPLDPINLARIPDPQQPSCASPYDDSDQADGPDCIGLQQPLEAQSRAAGNAIGVSHDSWMPDALGNGSNHDDLELTAVQFQSMTRAVQQVRF